MSTELDVTEGVQFDKGYLSPYFVTDPESMEAVLDDALVLLVSGKIGALADLLPLLEKVLSTGGRPLLIVAEDVEGEALSTLVVNSIRKTIKVVAVKSPYFGDRRKAFMTDLAVVTGGQVVSEDVGLSLDHGRPRGARHRPPGHRRPRTTPRSSTAAAPPRRIGDRVAQIRREIEATDSDWDREKLQERLAKLAGGIGVIRVGAATEVELKERKHRIEDAIAATRAAVEEGVIPGGGSALVHAASAIDALDLTGDELTGARAVRTALDAPLARIAENAGFEGRVVVSKVRELGVGQGFNAATGEYGDLAEQGVIDPVKVTKAALGNAASIAAMVLTTDSAVVEKPAEEEHEHAGAGTTPTATRTAGTATATERPDVDHRRGSRTPWQARAVSRRPDDTKRAGPDHPDPPSSASCGELRPRRRRRRARRRSAGPAPPRSCRPRPRRARGPTVRA